jgi:penicillin-binding protein 2
LALAREKVLSKYKERIGILIKIVNVFLGILLLTAFYLQVVRGGYYRDLSFRNSVRTYPIFASRGVIYDRDGNILADNYPTHDLYVVGEYLLDEYKKCGKDITKLRVYDFLVKELKLDPEEVRNKLQEAVDSPYQPVLIKKDMDDWMVAKVEALNWSIAGLYTEVGEKRYYPYGPLFAHVLGYVGESNIDEVKNYYYLPGEFVGRDGIEKTYETYLRGVGGWEQWEVDAVGRKVRLLRKAIPTKGKDLFTTLLLPLQQKAAIALGNRSGAVVAMDPNTGEIFCYYSSPPYDPNLFTRGIKKDDWNRLIDDPNKPLLDRVRYGLYPPGSTFKMVMLLAGLMEGKINQNTSVTCIGKIHFGNRDFRCWKKEGHGIVNLYRALVESCDVYFYMLGINLGVDLIEKYARLLGYGQKTGIDMPGEATGLVPNRDWKRRVFKQPWYPGETLPLSIGQGYLRVTPLQQLVMVSFFANGGFIVQPHIRKDVSPNVIKIDVPREYIDMIRNALLGVVEDKRGTAHYTVKVKDVLIAGKTGTAQVVGRDIEERYKSGKHISRREYKEHGWFVAFAPYEKPLIAVSVIVEHGGHGSSSAGPVAKEVILEYLKYKGIIPQTTENGANEGSVNRYNIPQD